MMVTQSLSKGLRKVFRFPSLIFWVWLAGLVIALPLAAAMRDTLQESIGASLVDENLRRGFDLDWYGEFSSRSSGLAETFGPSVVGILPVAGNLERLLDGRILTVNRVVLAAGILFLFAWAFFSGGIITRYAKSSEPATRSAFFAASAEYFFRYLRLLIISLLVYWAIFRWVAVPLMSLISDWTRDVTVERTVMIYTVLVYLLTSALLVIGGMVFDYAKIAMVVEERSSAILAFLRGIRFMGANFLRTAGLYLILSAVGLGLLAAFSLVAPGPEQSTDIALIIAFLIGQAYLIARLILKLWFLSSETVLFQTVSAVKEPEPVVPEPEAA